MMSRSQFAAYAAAAAGEADAEAESSQHENENVFTEAVSLSRTGHAIVAQFRAVTEGVPDVSVAALVANALAGVSISSTPPPAPNAAAVLSAAAASAGSAAEAAQLGSGEQVVQGTGFIAVGRGIARQETSSENLYTSDSTHFARSADDVAEDTQASRSPSAERPLHTAHKLPSHCANMAWGTQQQ